MISLFTQSANLEATIRANLKGLGYALCSRTKRNPGPWHRREGREKGTRGAHADISRMLICTQG